MKEDIIETLVTRIDKLEKRIKKLEDKLDDILFFHTDDITPKDDIELTEEEKKHIEKRLKELGYM